MTDIAERIRASLAALEPESIDLRDDSAQHAGHAGAGAGGHYSLAIVSPRFAGAPRVARHRMIYEALGPLMRDGIHALAIDARTPDEAAR